MTYKALKTLYQINLNGAVQTVRMSVSLIMVVALTSLGILVTAIPFLDQIRSYLPVLTAVQLPATLNIHVILI
jgi:hypothetical protein